MYKRYFRKKDPTCPVDKIEWIEMTGTEYYNFINAPENKNRYFIDMDDVVLEGTKDEAREQRAVKDRGDYLQEQESGWSIVSLYTITDENGCSGEEAIRDESQDVEAEALMRVCAKDLYDALAQLDAASSRLIYSLFLADERKTFRQLSKESGIPVMTLEYRKKKAFVRLRKILSKNFFVQNAKKFPI